MGTKCIEAVLSRILHFSVAELTTKCYCNCILLYMVLIYWLSVQFCADWFFVTPFIELDQHRRHHWRGRLRQRSQLLTSTSPFLWTRTWSLAVGPKYPFPIFFIECTQRDFIGYPFSFLYYLAFDFDIMYVLGILYKPGYFSHWDI